MKFYRYELWGCGEFESLRLDEYGMIKETPMGYWIGYPDQKYSGFKKWVSKTCTKRFAYPTKEEALTGYIKRTERRLMILKHHIVQCKKGLDLAKTK